jgi:hypothetical protein
MGHNVSGPDGMRMGQQHRRRTAIKIIQTTTEKAAWNWMASASFASVFLLLSCSSLPL